jgi:hypothetical protein
LNANAALRLLGACGRWTRRDAVVKFALNARRLALAHGTVHVGRQRLSKSTILALVAGFIAVGAALSGAAWESYRTSQREASIFASLSADAFKQAWIQVASA